MSSKGKPDLSSFQLLLLGSFMKIWTKKILSRRTMFMMKATFNPKLWRYSWSCSSIHVDIFVLMRHRSWSFLWKVLNFVSNFPLSTWTVFDNEKWCLRSSWSAPSFNITPRPTNMKNVLILFLPLKTMYNLVNRKYSRFLIFFLFSSLSPTLSLSLYTNTQTDTPIQVHTLYDWIHFYKFIHVWINFYIKVYTYYTMAY